MLKVEIHRSKVERQYWFRIVARNGKILCDSELYHKKQACIKTARLIMNNEGYEIVEL